VSSVESGFVDLSALDRDVARVAPAVERHRALLGSGDVDGARALDPFRDHRYVAGQTTWRALRDLAPAPADAPLRDALSRWVYEGLQARLDKDLAEDDAAAVHAVDARLRPKEENVAKTFAEAWRRVLDAPDGARGAIALARAGDLALPVAAARKERRSRRFEIARRLDLAHPEALVAPDAAALVEKARDLLDRTELLAKELLRAEQRRAEGPWTAAHAIHLALAKDAREGWPAKLGARWFDDVFGAIAPRGAPLRSVPAPLGGASFLRAAEAWGASLRAVGTARSLPFALARDPYPRACHRFGGLMAVALADPVLQKRCLSLPARLAAAQGRSLRAALFFELRARAARLVLAWPELSDRALFEEITTRLFGAPLPAALAGVWPAPRVDEAARMLALLDVPAFARSLVDRFDEDWFRNPKAGAHLAGLACAPLWDGDPPPADAVQVIARIFEETLG
jgi:hypothetical protein